jgi:hypothetical protein
MTALNVIVGSLAAYVITDTAVYPRENHVAKCFAPKVATIPHLPGAVGVSGPAGLAHLFGSVLYTEATELDELMSGGAREAVGAAAQLMGTAMRLVIAGWSQRDGAVAWHFSGDRFVPIQRGGVYASPAEDAAGWVPVPENDPGFVASLVDLVGRQRARFPVGGAVMLTTVRAEGIEQRILHRRPDRIGDVLGPATLIIAPGGAS